MGTRQLRRLLALLCYPLHVWYLFLGEISLLVQDIFLYLQDWYQKSRLAFLIRRFSLIEALHCFYFTASSVACARNSVVDTLTRFQFQKFRHLAPQASAQATPIPGSPLEELQVL